MTGAACRSRNAFEVASLPSSPPRAFGNPWPTRRIGGPRHRPRKVLYSWLASWCAALPHELCYARGVTSPLSNLAKRLASVISAALHLDQSWLAFASHRSSLYIPGNHLCNAPELSSRKSIISCCCVSRRLHLLLSSDSCHCRRGILNINR